MREPMKGRYENPVVGDLATYCIGSDSYAYTVTEVSASGHRITLQSRTKRRCDGGGLGDTQRYLTAENKDGAVMVATRRRTKVETLYRPKGSKCGYVVFGVAHPHMDPSF